MRVKPLVQIWPIRVYNGKSHNFQHSITVVHRIDGIENTYKTAPFMLNCTDLFLFALIDACGSPSAGVFVKLCIFLRKKSASPKKSALTGVFEKMPAKGFLLDVSAVEGVHRDISHTEEEYRQINQ